MQITTPSHPGRVGLTACASRGKWGWALLAPFAFWLGSAQAANLVVGVPYPPSPLPTTDGQVLVYELNVRNLDESACARLVDVRARGGSGESAIALHYQGEAISANAMAYTRDMTRVADASAPGAPASVNLPAGGGGVLFFFVALGQGKPAPAMLRHTLLFTPCTGAEKIQTVMYDLPVLHQAPIVIGLPFSGAGWVAGDSVNAKGTHRRTLIPLRDASGKPLAGQFHVPERYAIDWVVVDEDARRAHGSVDRNASYLAFGKSVIAVADGVIARTRDGYPEQTPPLSPPNPTVEMAAGNYLMQDIGGGHFAFYAHLQPGSLRVKQGQRVKRGQVLALLGNTGNSTEPHLHFHVSNADDPLKSEGLPYVFDRFEQTGHVEGMNEATGMFDDYLNYAPMVRTARMPASFSVLRAGMGLASPAPQEPSNRRRRAGSSPH